MKFFIGKIFRSFFCRLQKGKYYNNLYYRLRTGKYYINLYLKKPKRNKHLWMSEIYTDNMVLQCNKVLKIRGHACPGDHIVVSFAGEERETFTCSDGRWCVIFPPLAVNNTGQTLSVRNGRHCLVYKNVLIGEVWLITGASIMLMKLANAESYPDELQLWEKQNLANLPVRFFLKRETFLAFPIIWPLWVCKALNKYDLLTRPYWAIVDRKTAGNVPAYAYYFAKMLTGKLHVPVGLICTAISGSPLEAWIEREYLAVDIPFLLEEGKENRFALDGWKSTMPKNIERSKIARQKHYWHPSFCFESQIRSLDVFPIKGVLYGGFLWSGGIENWQEQLFSLFIRNLRDNWSENLPVYYIQLGRWEFAPVLPLLRDLERKMERNIPNVKMVVTYDTFRKGVDRSFYHPYNRKDVGDRLARLALYYTYKDATMIPCGPLFHEARLRENFIYIKFDWSKDLTVSDDSALEEFEIAGEDRCFQRVRVSIADDEVVIKCPESIPAPKYIRYGWKEYIPAYLMNGEGIPLSTFEEKIVE